MNLLNFAAEIVQIAMGNIHRILLPLWTERLSFAMIEVYHPD